MRGSAVLTRTGPLSMLLLAMVFTFACATVLGPGKAELPAGIDQARVPDVDYGGFLYVGADPPLTLAPELLRSKGDESTPVAATTTLALRSATIVAGVAGQEFGGAFTFDSTEAAGYALTQLMAYGLDEHLWSKAVPPDLLLVKGESGWADSVRVGLLSGDLVGLSEADPEAWTLLTNLPSNPPSHPIGVGVLEVEDSLLGTAGDLTDLDLESVGDAFRFVGVTALAFGVYWDGPFELPAALDRDFVRESGASVLLVSNSGYPGVLVSFILSIASGRAGLELIELGDTNARYRTIDGLHMVVKNRGSLVYGALAGSRSAAEDLILSAIADQ